MSNTERPVHHITWLGGRAFKVTVMDERMPYRYLVEAEDGTFQARVRHDDSLAIEIEQLIQKGEPT